MHLHRVLPFLALAACLLSACPKDDDTDTPKDDTQADTDTDTDADTDTDTDTDDTGLRDCRANRGICTTSDLCETTEIEVTEGSCDVGEDPGVCCTPPAPQATGEDCASYGGVCTTGTGCARVAGWFAPGTCDDGGPIVCCVPESACGPHNFVCCATGADPDPEPLCDRDGLTCEQFPGTTLIERDKCK